MCTFNNMINECTSKINKHMYISCSFGAFKHTQQHFMLTTLYPYIYQGNAINVKRTVFGYARAGMAGMMIEDQVSPKRCGHVAGKSVVPFDEAVQRVKAACDAR